MEWKLKSVVYEGEKLEINGTNIWDFEWKLTGKKINISDPLYGQPFCFNIYEIENNNDIIFFAAGTFSNGVFGIYVNELTIQKKAEPVKKAETNLLNAFLIKLKNFF